MRNKLLYTIFAGLIFSTSLASAQPIIRFLPSDFNLALGTGNIDQTFDISAAFGKAAGSAALTITNGFVNDTDDAWTVSELESTTFSVNSVFGLRGVVQHGGNLGSEAHQNGSLSRDGIFAFAGESWSLISSLDSDYQAGQAGATGNNYFVDYVGAETNQLESNSTGFRWMSDQDMTGVTVYSRNTVDLNNNYSIFFQDSSAVPEPASAALLGLGACLVVLRRKRS